MRVLFTADWHLKLGQKNVPREWAVNRYSRFFQQIAEIEPEVRLHIIGGDLFDRLPTMEELELYFSFVAGCQVDTIIYDGNHEATKKNHTFFSALREVTHRINPLVTVVDDTYTTDMFSILPYRSLHKKGEIEKLPTDRPLFTHVRGEIPPHVTPEIDLDRLSPFPIVFAGDLHSHSNSQRNIVYPGSPMTTSFHRTIVQTGYLIIDLESEEWIWEKFDLPQLIRKTVSDTSEMLETDYHHTIYELEGDVQDLAKVANSDLLDKKIVKRSSETALILEKGMSIGEELSEYLSYILELPEDKVTSIQKTFYDYTTGIEME